VKAWLRVGILGRYLARQNLYYLLVCLGLGAGLYLLSDIFDRLDDFLEAGLGARTILTYFAVKIPLILAQILPAVFFLALLVQLSLMARNRELLALRAGGTSPMRFIRFFVLYALIWSLAQLLFSQFVAVYGEEEATRIWKEEVRKKQIHNKVITNVWFRDGPYIVRAKEAVPSQSRARDITVYEFDPDSQQLVRILSAQKALVDDNGWGLLEVIELDTGSFVTARRVSQYLSVRQDLRAFLDVEQIEDKAQLPLWKLGRVIDELAASGSNVDRLRTAWHGKWSYAFSILCMALMALALTSFVENVYLNVTLCLVLVFLQYGVHLFGVTAGQQGVLTPLLAAWFGNASFGILASLRLAWISNPREAERIRQRILILRGRLKERLRHRGLFERR
jgi:lipopolysaccharide export system permease protein